MALKNNRPLLMLMLADILNGFTLRSQIDTYTRSILNFANFDFISGIPGSPVSFASFAYVPRLRGRFSTKALWVAGDYVNSPMQLLIYLYGMVRVRNPAKLARGVTHRFLDLAPMLIAFGIQNTVDMTLWGTKKVVRAEIRNECIDYGEWKNGFRAEAMVGVLRGMPVKVTGMFGGAMTGLVLKLIGFQTGANYNQQTTRTARGVFALSTIVPAAMSLVSLAPEMLYNLNRNERARMYAELAERRAAMAAAHGEGVHNG